MEDEKACGTFEAALCRDFSNLKMIRANSSGSSNQFSGASASLADELTAANDVEMENQEDPREFIVDIEEPEETPTIGDGPDLVRNYLIYVSVPVLNHPQGAIGQDTLSAMIRQDEMAPTRSRRRSYYYSIYGIDVNGKLDFPIGEYRHLTRRTVLMYHQSLYQWVGGPKSITIHIVV